MANVTTVRFRSMFAGLRSTRRKNIAAKYLREQIARLNGASIESVKINRRVNDYITGNVINRSAQLKLTVNKTKDGVEVRLAEDKWAPKISAAPVTGKQPIKPAAGIIAEKPKQQEKPAPAKAEKPKVEQKVGTESRPAGVINEKPKAEQKKEQKAGAESKPAGVVSEKPKAKPGKPAQAETEQEKK